MAFSKNGAGVGKKVVIVIICIILALAMTIPSLGLLFAGSSEKSGGTDSTTASEETASKTLDQVNADYQAAVDTYTRATTDSPDDLKGFVNLGNAYLDWAQALQNYIGQNGVSESIAIYYSTAMAKYDVYLVASTAEQTTDAYQAVATDRAIAQYYGSDPEGAIAALEANTLVCDTYAPCWENLGIFYENEGDTEKAKAAYQKALDVDPADGYGVKTFSEARLSNL